MATEAQIRANRENAKKGGRPVGSKTKPQFRDYMSAEEMEGIVASMIAEAQNGKIEAAKWLGDQFFGRPTTKIAGDEEADPLKFIEIIRNESNDQSTT